MLILSQVLVGLVALFHVYFMILEMFLWQKPIGLKTFRNSPEKAEITSVLAANQGLYNGFLAGGLLLSFFVSAELSLAFRYYFLSCVIIAGIYGAITANKRILFIQSAPALIALILVVLA